MALVGAQIQKDVAEQAAGEGVSPGRLALVQQGGEKGVGVVVGEILGVLEAQRFGVLPGETGEATDNGVVCQEQKGAVGLGFCGIPGRQREGVLLGADRLRIPRVGRLRVAFTGAEE